MKIVRFIDDKGVERLGRDPRDGTAEILDGSLSGGLRPTGRHGSIRKLLAPVNAPNIFGVGLNYWAQLRQAGGERPQQPPLFMKPTTSITHPGDPILVPQACLDVPEVDFECELAVVIGQTVRDVSAAHALDFVLGYTAANDVTGRRLAKSCRARAKSFDGWCPLGPALVTADELPDPQGLELATELNGTTVQRGNTADMIFPVAEIISYLSQDTTLLPGTVILTGTPFGSGVTHTPPIYLRPGDEVVVEIPGIGRLCNPVRAARPMMAAA